MKHDVLKQDATGSFLETTFYTSGQFQDSLDIVIEDASFIHSSGNGVWFCKPQFSIRLTDKYANELKNIWGGEKIKVEVFESSPLAERESYITNNFNETFRVVERSKTKCGNPNLFIVKVSAVSPNNRVVAGAQKEFAL